MKLSDIKIGGRAVIVKVAGHGGFRRRIVEMGFVKGKVVDVLAAAPLGDPIEYSVMGYNVSLRRSEAEKIEVISVEEAEEILKEQGARSKEQGNSLSHTDDIISHGIHGTHGIRCAAPADDRNIVPQMTQINTNEKDLCQFVEFVGNKDDFEQSEKSNISVQSVDSVCKKNSVGEKNNSVSKGSQLSTLEEIRQVALDRRREIQVALVGNPNAGKTSLFNAMSGAREKVGNYSGVTVDAKEVDFEYKGYKIKLVDLPGTYSLSAYSPEERYVRQQIVKERPDVIVNVVDAGNLERNLFLTTQLIDMNLRMVIALNMYDELEAKGDVFDYESLSAMIGVPMVPTVSMRMRGVAELLDTVIRVYEGGDYIDADGRLLAQAENDELLDKHYHELNLPHTHTGGDKRNRTDLVDGSAVHQYVRHIHINYGTLIEDSIRRVKTLLQEMNFAFDDYTPRYLAIKLIEGDDEIMHNAQCTMHNAQFSTLNSQLSEIRAEIQREFKDTAENVINDAKYGFIAGALKETYTAKRKERGKTLTDKIDNVVTNRWLGYPIFLLALFITFQATFVVGAYPMDWIDAGVAWVADWLRGAMAEGMLRDLLVDGIVSGVGGVLVFLPNILILYFFISLMEASGYMARAAFIMDKLMHHIGLHGRSFIPLFMGFGCNVPAIMATRTIENRNARMITILILPLMSCSARLPIFLLLAGTFFPANAGVVLFAMYMIGVLLAALMAVVFRKVLFNKEETPFVMELPPYRMPSVKTMLRETWDKGVQYLRKIGTTILVGSIVIWALSYFPLESQQSIVSHTDDIVSHGDNISHTDYTEDVVATPADDRNIVPQMAQINTNKKDSCQFVEFVGEKTNLDGNFEQSEKSNISVQSVQSVREENNSVREKENSVRGTSQLENSYLGRIGKFVQPVLEPLGFDWKASVALVTGVTAKEIVVSTFGVLYSVEDVEDTTSLSERLLEAKDENGEPLYDGAVAISLMLFVLIYLPCIGTLATVKSETGSWWWAAFVAIYTIVLAWIVSFVVYQSLIHNIWQEVLVGAILLGALIYVVMHLVRKLRRSNSSPCDGCSSSGCSGCAHFK